MDHSECSVCHVSLSLNDGCEWGTHALCYGCMEDELTKAEARIRELEKALQTLLDEHNCDDGSVDYDGMSTECERCYPARALLADKAVKNG